MFLLLLACAVSPDGGASPAHRRADRDGLNSTA